MYLFIFVMHEQKLICPCWLNTALEKKNIAQQMGDGVEGDYK